jgi:hypothetical protein
MNQLVRECIAAFVPEGSGGGHCDDPRGNCIFQSGSDVAVIQDYGR